MWRPCLGSTARLMPWSAMSPRGSRRCRRQRFGCCRSASGRWLSLVRRNSTRSCSMPIAARAGCGAEIPTGGFLASEGAGGVLVRRARPEDERMILSARDGWIYRTKSRPRRPPQVCWVKATRRCPATGARSAIRLGPMEQKITAGRPAPADAPYLGEAFTASAAWHTLRALNALSPQMPHLLVPVWGLNHQLGLLELTQPRCNESR